MILPHKSVEADWLLRDPLELTQRLMSAYPEQTMHLLRVECQLRECNKRNPWKMWDHPISTTQKTRSKYRRWAPIWVTQMTLQMKKCFSELVMCPESGMNCTIIKGMMSRESKLPRCQNKTNFLNSLKDKTIRNGGWKSLMNWTISMWSYLRVTWNSSRESVRVNIHKRLILMNTWLNLTMKRSLSIHSKTMSQSVDSSHQNGKDWR